MNARTVFGALLVILSGSLFSQQPANPSMAAKIADTTRHLYQAGNAAPIDSTPTVNLKDVNIISFKNKEDWMTYYKYKSRIIKVMPYVKIAKELYVELMDEKENSKKRQYKHYRKDVEKEMRAKFEKELKNLTTGQGEMLFKLLNRETHNNSYTLIKEVKGSMMAWVYQIVAKKWGYDLKEKYDPEKEKMIELIIKELGPAYKV